MSSTDWRTLDLSADGRSLIEASAGTGKTWTIAALYLRLLLENGLTPRQVAVATFSEAAAQELRERIRDRIQRAASVLINGTNRATPDEVEAWLLARSDPGDAARLRLCLAELDIAPIGTLHALCQRILREQPFHTGAGFGGVALVDGSRLHAGLADDLWRRWTQLDVEADPTVEPWLASGRSKLSGAVALALRPGVRLPECCEDAVAALLQEGDAQALRDRAEDVSWFQRSDSKWRRCLRALAAWIEAGDANAIPDCAGLLEPLEGKIKPGRHEEADADAAFAFARRAARLLTAAGPQRRLAGIVGAVPSMRAAAQTRMQAAGQRSFDSLLTDVHDALRDGPALADALRAQWPVALVDEFQDTDPVQYAILDAIYPPGDGEGGMRGRLVMVGDPKQAIYGFRGGDVHSYLRAARTVAADGHLPLTINQRSTTGYVDACNAFFERGEGRLTTAADCAEAIAYRRVQASGRHDARAYSIDGEAVTRPLVFHYRSEESPIDGHRRAALEGCAELVVRMLDGSHRIGDAPLQPGDLAVLLPKNAQVAALRAMLVARGVPCVGAGRSNVFHAPAAQWLALQLHAAAEPRDASAVRAAMATPLGGETFASLRAMRDADGESDPRWQAVQQHFESLRERWQSRGVLAAVQAIIAHARPLLAAHGDPERALTDLRHLGELLQARALATPGALELLGWLAAQRSESGADDEDAAEERSLRLESDARRVQLMTLHAAKGLEFPVVLLPMLWDHVGRSEALVAVNDGEAGRVLRNDAAAIAQHARDNQDERLRLLYVALTRASHACHVFALDPERTKRPGGKKGWTDPERSALDALLSRAFDDIGWPETGKTLRDAADSIDWIDGWPQGGARLPSAVEAMPSPAVVRPLPAPPTQLPRRHSFSTLVRHQGAAALEETAASDEAVAQTGEAMQDVPRSPVHPQLVALQPWKGTGFGNALHDILELREVSAALSTQRTLVAESLLRHGVSMPAEAIDAVVARLDAVLEAALPGTGARLREVAAGGLRAEMGFDYRLDGASGAVLRGVLQAHGWNLPPLPASTLHGAMTGKIDLVFEHADRFHVLDWKGNWLGDALDDYRAGSLEAAMDAHHYRLQALLYTVALDRYLRDRLGPRYRRADHLGETIYLFLRAVGLDGDAGVWVHRFDDALLDAVDEALRGTEVAA